MDGRWRRICRQELPWIREMTTDGGRRGCQRTGEDRPGSLALPTGEIAIAGADGDLSRLELIAIHRDAHRTARFAPLSAGIQENAGQALGFSLAFDSDGSRHDHQAQACGD